MLESDLPATPSTSCASDSSDNATLDSMMSTYGRDASNNPWDPRFYGAPSGLAFIQRTQEFFTGPVSECNHRPKSSQSAVLQLFDAPLPGNHIGDGRTHLETILPPKETALALITTVFTKAYMVFPIFDEPVFFRMVDRIYDTGARPDEVNPTFKPSFHIVLGLGYLFSRSKHEEHRCQGAIDEA